MMITCTYFALKKDICARLMRSHCWLHITCALEEKRIEMVQLHAGYIFGFAGGSGFVKGGVMEEGKLERLMQAQYGHRSFWLLLCYHLLISCTCTLVGGTSAQEVHLL